MESIVVLDGEYILSLTLNSSEVAPLSVRVTTPKLPEYEGKLQTLLSQLYF